MNKLAIIDWGIGGLGIYKLLKEQVGTAGSVYLSDTGATPYGKMSRQDLIARLNLVFGFLKTLGVTHTIVGCNAASTVIPFLDEHDIQISGIIESAIAKTLSAKPRRLGLIGGRRTVLSGVYRRAFSSYGIKVDQRIAQPLSGIIESGNFHSDKLKQTAEDILRPIRNSTHILLACTHYPAIQPLLQSVVSSGTSFIDPTETLVNTMRHLIPLADGCDEFYTTGDPLAMSSAARSAFDVHISRPQRVTIEISHELLSPSHV